MPVSDSSTVVTTVVRWPKKAVFAVLLADPLIRLELHLLTRASPFQLVSGSRFPIPCPVAQVHPELLGGGIKPSMPLIHS
jgi:hypothetical protein